MWKRRVRGTGDVAVLRAVLFLRAWTPARLWAGLARGHLGRSALNVDGAWQGLFSTRMVARRSRARKGAENRIQADRLGQCERLRRAVDCAPYLNSLRLR